MPKNDMCKIAGVRVSGDTVHFHWSSGAESMIKGGKYNAVMLFDFDQPTNVLVTRLPHPMSKFDAMRHLLTLSEFTAIPGVTKFLESRIENRIGMVKRREGVFDHAQVAADTKTPVSTAVSTAAEPNSEYHMQSECRLVEAWSAWYLPYMNQTQAQRQYRDELGDRIKKLNATGSLDV